MNFWLEEEEYDGYWVESFDEDYISEVFEEIAINVKGKSKKQMRDYLKADFGR